MERFHATGYVYNNLNLENMFLDRSFKLDESRTTNYDIFEDENIFVIDSSNATIYFDEDSWEHINQEKLDTIQGKSIIF